MSNFKTKFKSFFSKEALSNKISSFADKINTPFVQRIGNSIISKKYLLPSLFVPMGIMLLVFMCLGVFPFYTQTILTLDMNGQYVYFFEQLRDILYGEASLLYTFERSLGGEFFGYYTYYLASPLSFIVALFPKKMITEAILTIMIVKSGLAGFTFSIYLDRTRKKNPFGFTMFSVMYALCSYATMFQSNTMWMDALIWLPLIALGLERLIKHGKFKLFTISLAMAVWSNYYIGYMICIFVALYFVCYICAHPTDEINGLGEAKHKLKSLGRVALYSFIALMMTGMVLFTAYYSLQFGKSTLQDNSFDPTLRFDILNLISKLFIGSYDTVRSEGTPNLYAGTLLIMMLPVYFMSKRIKGREKIAFSVLCGILAISFTLNTIDLIWHGFQMPIWLNYRYSFLLTFVLLTMAYKGFESLEDIDCKFIGKSCVFLVLLLAVIQKLVTFTRYQNGVSNQVTPSFEMIWLSIILMTVYFILIYAKKHSKIPHTISAFLTIIVCIEAFSSTMINWVGEIVDAGWASRENYRSYVDRLEYVTDEINKNDKTFFRMEKTLYRKPNDNLVLNMNGITEFTSTFNGKTMKFLNRMGIYTSSQTTRFFSGNEVMDSILGVKYMLATNEEHDYVSGLYTPHSVSNGIVVYENPYALPIAYGVSDKIKEATLSEHYSPFGFQEYLMGHMMGENNLDVFEACDFEISKLYNCQDYKNDEDNSTSYYRVDSSKHATFTFSVTASYDGSIYMFLPTQYSTPAQCYVNGRDIGTLFQGETYRAFNIGNYKKGDTVEVMLKFEANRIFLYNYQKLFVQINEKVFNDTIDTLKSNGLNIESYSDTHFYGTMTLDNDMSVFTTIPYDKNWRVYIDGKRIETYEVVESMLGFDAPSGEHTVELRFAPLEFYIGLSCTVIGIGALVTLGILDSKKRKASNKSII